MGAINYGTSDYITIGIKERDYWYEDENGKFDEEMSSVLFEEKYEQAKEILDEYDFYFYNVSLEYGYYDGFYINIENNYDLAYEDYIDKREAQKEITQIKKCLTELIDFGMCAVYPGWVTEYKNYKESLELLNEAIKEMRDEARNTPTVRTCDWAHVCPV